MAAGKNNMKALIELCRKNIEQTDSCKYLGIMIQNDNKNEAKMNTKLENKTTLFPEQQFIGNKEASRKN